VSASDPLTSRCPARCKSSGMQCRKWVRGGGVCDSHGGRARQVKAAREARLVVMEAELEATRKAEPYEARHPAEVLLTAVLASDVLLRHLLDKHAAGELTADESMALGWAIDRAARVSRSALDASVNAQIAQVAQERASVWLTAMRHMLADPRVHVDGDPEDIIFGVLQAMRDGDAPTPALSAGNGQAL
jgi:hypothetical protein